MKHLFIVNPKAGGSDRTAEVRSIAQSVLQDKFEIYVTGAPLDATEEVRRRGESGEEYRIYACGGDGTFNECCNGANGFSNLAVAPFPLGTGNDFCRMFGDDAELYRNLRALVNGRTVPIDLIDCSGRACAGICSVGIDARVGTGVHNYPSWLGPMAYAVSLVSELTKGLYTKMKIDCGGEHLEGSFMLCCICNGRYYGGGFQPSLSAMPNDGDLDIYIVRPLNIVQIASALGRYAKGRSDELPDKVIHLHGDRIRVELEKPANINIDGEALYSDVADVKLLPGAMNLIVPEGMTFFD